MENIKSSLLFVFTIFVYTTRRGVNGFTLDPVIGEFHAGFFFKRNKQITACLANEIVSRNNLKSAGNDSSILVTDTCEISDTFLLNYLRQRRTNLSVANTFCREVYFTLNDKNYRAIGFKNNAGGYDIRNAFFKGSSSPKYVTHLDWLATIRASL